MQLSEKAYELCLAIEDEGAAPELTECSVMAAALRKKLCAWEDVSPMTDEENTLINEGLEKLKTEEATGKSPLQDIVGRFQCPGCVCGGDPQTCEKYNYSEDYLKCVSHVLGTHVGLGNPVALGLPKGFNKPGITQDGKKENKMDMRLFRSGEKPLWDHLNVPVWAMEKDGFLFVRTFAPRIDLTWVDVIENGTLDLCPDTVIDVADFYDDID